VSRAVGEQVVGDVLVKRTEARRPSDDLELVVVAGADRVGAMLDQSADDAELPGGESAGAKPAEAKAPAPPK